MATNWALAPGDSTRRTELHDAFGGSRQGGISPSSKSPNLFLFSDPASGLQHGYVDHWDGIIFHYTGEGQRGDQEMNFGNRAELDHASEGRTLRMFRGSSGIVTYVGEFTLDVNRPFYTTDSPATGEGAVRQVIVFRLLPSSSAQVALLPAENMEFAAGVEEVDLAQANTEKAWVEPDREPYAAELRETILVNDFRSWLESRRQKVSRLRIVPAGEAKPLFNDVWVPNLQLLVEAKGTCTREAVRMAVGQLIDYGRFKPEAQRAILLPERPRPDLVELVMATGMILIWQAGTSFVFYPETPRPAHRPGAEHGSK